MTRQEHVDQISIYLKEKFNFSQEQIDELMPKFIETLVTHFNTLQEVMKNGNRVEVRKTGHKMKGALLNLGMQHCAAIALEIEKTEDSSESEDIADLVLQLQHCLGTILTE